MFYQQQLTVTVTPINNLHKSLISDLFLLHDETVVTCSTDHTAKRWNINETTQTLITSYVGHTASIRSGVELSESTIATSAEDSTIKVWNTHTGECLHTEPLDHGGYVLSFTRLRSESSVVVCITSNGATDVRILDRMQRLFTLSTSMPADIICDVSSMCELKDGTLLTLHCEENLMRLWEVKEHDVFGDCVEELCGTDILHVFAMKNLQMVVLIVQNKPKTMVMLWDESLRKSFRVHHLSNMALYSDNTTMIELLDDKTIVLGSLNFLFIWNYQRNIKRTVVPLDGSVNWCKIVQLNDESLVIGGSNESSSGGVAIFKAWNNK